MNFGSIVLREWKTSIKTALNMTCLLLLFFVSANNVWGEITIKAESSYPDPLRPGKFEKFKAKAFRTNTHGFLSTPGVRDVPGITPDPKIGYIEFSATGNAKKSWFSKLKGGRNWPLGFTHSVKYKWDNPGMYTVTAQVFDEDGNSHGSVQWYVQVGELTFDPLPNLPLNPSKPDPPEVQVWPETSDSIGYVDRVGSDMAFEVQATSDDGIASIRFVLENPSGSSQEIDKKDNFFPDKKILFFWPTFKVDHTWSAPGDYKMIAEITTKDGGYREVTWDIEVEDINQPPSKISGVSVVDLGSLTIGGSPETVDVDAYFSDPEGDRLQFDEVEVHRSTPGIITLNLLDDGSGFKSIMEIEPKNPGRAFIYAIARERDGLVATQSFMVLVESEQNRSPIVVDTIPTHTLTTGSSSPPLYLSTYFRDPDGDTLTYTAESSNLSVAIAQGVGSQLTISPLSSGSATVTVTATDPDGLYATQTFNVTVTNTPLPNRAPETVGTIPAQAIPVGASSVLLDLFRYFRDPDADPLTYTVVSSNPNVITTQRAGSQLTISPLSSGSATVTVTATDPDGLYATQAFTVTVAADDPFPQPPPSQGLSVGDPIIVQNTGSIRLNIRSTARVSNQNPDNRIGRASDGATGTIMAGSQQDAEGRTWWEIEWDASNKVQWTQQPANNRGWSVEAVGQVGLLARRPPDPVTQSYDLAIQSFTISKDTLDPGESFTLLITVHNNGPNNSTGSVLSYYHSSIQGFSPTDPPQVQGTVSLNPLAPGDSTTQSIQLKAPTTPKTYYYGAWLSANSGDTNLNNDSATEVGVTISDDRPDDPPPSDRSDLIVTNISVDYDTMHPGERFTVSATVENVGGRRAPNTRLRYYTSSDSIFSTDDEEIENKSDGIGGLDSGETSDEDVHLDAPSEPGVYYYIARADKVRNEVKTSNNYAAIQITVLPPRAPDLVVSLSANRYLVDPGKYFRLDATILNQGEEDSDHTTTVRFYLSSDPTPSLDDEEIAAETVKKLKDGSDDEESENGPAPREPGAYYYYACVDSVPGERNTDNNCSNVVTINVRGPDLVVHSVSVQYPFRKDTAARPDSRFKLHATVRNQGTEDADRSPLRYYVSLDPNLSSEDTEVATNRGRSLDINEISKTLDSGWIPTPYTSGFFYCFVCVDSLEEESDTDNNCSDPIEIRILNYAPRAKGAIPDQALTVGTSVSVDISDYFTDTNNDSLTYTASSSSINVITASMAGPEVTLTPVGIGIANVTITASDGTLTATQTIAVTVESTDTTDTNVCARTPQVRDAIVAAVTGVSDCGNVTDAHLAAIPLLNLTSTGITSLKAIDFRDLSNVTSVRLDSNQLTALPRDVFSDLSNIIEVMLENNQLTGLDATLFSGLNKLEYLLLGQNQLSALDTNIFNGLSNLHTLGLRQNRLSSLNVNIFSGLNNLQHVTLGENQLSTLDANIFSGLSNLQALSLEFNQLSALEAGIFNGLNNLQALLLNNNRLSALDPTLFSGLSNLQSLYLSNNQLTALPAGIFSGLNALNFVWLWGNPGAPFTLTLELTRTDNINPEAGGPATVKVKLAEGAPFDMNISLSVENGTLSTNTATLTTGQTESTPITVTQNGANLATVRLGAAPTVPQDYLGIQMAVGAPLVLFSDENTPAEAWMPNANLRKAVRTALGLAPNTALTQQTLLGLTQLKYVGPDLRNNEKITDLTGLEHALNLEHLDLYAHLIRNLRPLENLPKLKSLWLAGNKIVDIRPLTNLPLEGLDLGGNLIKNFAPLAELTGLRRLDFWGNGLGDSDLTHITGLTGLTELDVRGNKITNVTGLTQLGNLEKLSLEGNAISDLAPLRELLRQNPNLEIDIEIDTAAKGADLMIQDTPQVNKTTVAPGGVLPDGDPRLEPRECRFKSDCPAILPIGG